MFNIDLWQEIWGTVRRNKLRTFLTGLSVAWGIFMLVVLLAAGRGLRNGIENQFKDDAVNSIWIRSGKTSIPFEGRGVGRVIQFTNDDYEALKRLPGVEYITSRYFLWNDSIVVRGDKHTAFDIRCVHPDHKYLEKTEIIKGRYLSDLDIADRRKVAVIGDEVESFLFKPDEDPVGQWIQISGLQFQVIGVFQDAGGQGERRKIFLPISTAQMAFGGSNRVNAIMFTVGKADADESQRIEESAKLLLARRHHFSPDEKQAVRLQNNLEEYAKFTLIFAMIELFVWLVGLATILAGIVGVSNIMLISVKERTREIGIRKSFGATPRSILIMITQEALVLTAVSGYLGLCAGVTLVEIARRFLPGSDFFRDPEVDLGVALTATAVLVLTGMLAGFFPAWRAARINPIEALRDE